jgi:hypothetical protein
MSPEVNAAIVADCFGIVTVIGMSTAREFWLWLT